VYKRERYRGGHVDGINRLEQRRERRRDNLEMERLRESHREWRQGNNRGDRVEDTSKDETEEKT
jgi:hypothetical protein